MNVQAFYWTYPQLLLAKDKALCTFDVQHVRTRFILHTYEKPCLHLSLHIAAVSQLKCIGNKT